MPGSNGAHTCPGMLVAEPCNQLQSRCYDRIPGSRCAVDSALTLLHACVTPARQQCAPGTSVTLHLFAKCSAAEFASDKAPSLGQVNSPIPHQLQVKLQLSLSSRQPHTIRQLSLLLNPNHRHVPSMHNCSYQVAVRLRRRHKAQRKKSCRAYSAFQQLPQRYNLRNYTVHAMRL
jgi:hypothetical protein